MGKPSNKRPKEKGEENLFIFFNMFSFGFIHNFYLLSKRLRKRYYGRYKLTKKKLNFDNY